MSNLFYLGCPYSHPDEEIVEERFHGVNRIAAGLLKHGILVFSPISHTHPLTAYGLPKEWAFWERRDREFLAVCRGLIVVKFDGWKESVGLRAEIDMAIGRGIPIFDLDPYDNYETLRLSRFLKQIPAISKE